MRGGVKEGDGDVCELWEQDDAEHSALWQGESSALGGRSAHIADEETAEVGLQDGLV